MSHVHTLIDWNQKSWRLDMIANLFQPEVIYLITSLPIGDCNAQDRLIWPHNKAGVYTVKSGYHWVQGMSISSSSSSATSSHSIDKWIWKSIWAIKTLSKIRLFLWRVLCNAGPTLHNLCKRKLTRSPLCPICESEEETFEHITLLCPWVQAIWFGSSLGLRIDRTSITTIDSWLLKSLDLLANVKNEFRSANVPVLGTTNHSPPKTIPTTWSPPPVGWVKVNSDAAWLPSSSAGLGVIIRDSSERVIGGLAEAAVIPSVEGAEAEAILRGVELAISLNLKQIIVESDSKQLISELLSSSVRSWRTYPALETIRRRSLMFDRCTWNWTPRSTNQAAHHAAMLARQTEDPL
ncbi:hypothetical protein ACLB2K_011727 [Fragaria x ananassa]